MAALGRAASVLSILNGAWAAYMAVVVFNTPLSCPSGGCPVTLGGYLLLSTLAVAVLLIIDSLVSFAGSRISYLAGATLSALILVLVLLQLGTFGTLESSISLVLSVLAAAADAWASRPARSISEQSHPLNLPVFG